MTHPHNPAEMPVFFTRTEAAKILRCSIPTLLRRCEDGTLHPVRIGARLLFRADELMNIGKEKK